MTNKTANQSIHDLDRFGARTWHGLGDGFPHDD